MALVLVVGAGAEWEAGALARLDQAPGIVVLRRCVDIDDLLAMATLDQADAAVLGADAPGLDARAIELLREHGVRPVVVVPSGPVAEAARQRALRSGATRLVGDDELDRLPAAILDPDEPAAEIVVEPEPPGEGRVTVVWGPAGAPGRTTVAAGLAALWAEDGPATLVDADPYGGAVAQQLGILDDVSGLLTASRMAAAGELETRLAGCLRMLSGELGVLTGLPRPDRWVELRVGTLAQIVAAGRRRGRVVVDTGFSIEVELDGSGRFGRNQLTLDALEVADDVVVVGSADPVGLSRLAQGLGELRERGLAGRATVLVNRMRPSLGWRAHEVVALLREAAGPVPVHFVPDDRASLDRATVAGRTLVEAAADSPVTKALAAVADALANGQLVPAP